MLHPGARKKTKQISDCCIRHVGQTWNNGHAHDHEKDNDSKAEAMILRYVVLCV
jgi:hypothetical protein